MIPCSRIAGKEIVLNGLGALDGEVAIIDLHGRVVARTRISGNGEVRFSIGDLSTSVFVVRAGSLKARRMIFVR